MSLDQWAAAHSTLPDEKPIAVVETEAALLGAMMIDGRIVDAVADRLAPDDFYDPVHQRLYEAIVTEHGAGRRANPITLRPLFEGDPGMAELGGPAYMASLTGSGAGLIGARDFADQIRDVARRRRLNTALRDALVHTRDMGASVADLAERTDAAVNDALQRSHVAAPARTFAEAWDRTMKSIEDEASGLTKPGLAVVGLDDWNDLTGNMRRGEVVILAGRPSMGKTAVGLSVAVASARAGHGTLFVSLEMSVEELTKRAISDASYRHDRRATFEDIQRGRFANDREQIDDTRREIDAFPLVFQEESNLRLSRLAILIRRHRRRMAERDQDLSVVFIDYLGLVKGDGNRQKRYEEVSEVSRTIKTLARELDIAIVLLAQLNREVERRDDKRPQLADLRDSGDIEQDADAVIFVYRPSYYLERNEPDAEHKNHAQWEIDMEAARDRVELIAAKVRKGRIGRRNCYFFAEHQAVRGTAYMVSGGWRGRRYRTNITTPRTCI